MAPLHFVQRKLSILKFHQIDNCGASFYTQSVRGFKRPEKLKRFLVPGVLLLSLFFLIGGLYFWNQSLGLSPKEAVNENEGVVSGLETGLPENFPKDIPFFKPAEILSSLESQERVQLTLQTKASVERVLQFYQKEMKELGWRLVGPLSFLKNGRQAQLVITSEPDGGPTLIILNTIP